MPQEFNCVYFYLFFFEGSIYAILKVLKIISSIQRFSLRIRKRNSNQCFIITMHFLDFITAIIQVLHAITLGTAGEILVRISKQVQLPRR